MNPHQQKKVDIKSLSPEEQRLFRLYGKLPSRSDHFAKHLKERKYFDSGDYAMSKAGKGDGVDTGSVGSQHPVPENIPHLSSPANNAHHGGGGSGISGLLHAHQHQPIATQAGVGVGATQGAGSPIKEASFLNRETSADDISTEEEKEEGKKEGGGGVPLGNNTEAIPRR